MDSFNTILLASSALLLVAVVSVRLADRTGLPSLLIYLGVGLAVGEAGRRAIPALGGQRPRPQLDPRASRRRQHELQRPTRGRAVLLGHPQRERHEVGGNGVAPHVGGPHEALDGDLRPGGQLDHHAVERLVAERDPDHGADAHVLAVRCRVVEGSGQPPGGGQRLDAQDHEGAGTGSASRRRMTSTASALSSTST